MKRRYRYQIRYRNGCVLFFRFIPYTGQWVFAHVQREEDIKDNNVQEKLEQMKNFANPMWLKPPPFHNPG